MSLFIRHNCGERKNTVGHRCARAFAVIKAAHTSIDKIYLFILIYSIRFRNFSKIVKSSSKILCGKKSVRLKNILP